LDPRKAPMTGEPLIIVGSGPAGLAAARAFRERDGNTPVLMITADRHPAYNRPPLTKDYLRGESERDELWLVEEDWYAEHDVELRLATRVSDLDPGRRHVTTTDGSTIPERVRIHSSVESIMVMISALSTTRRGR